MASPSWVSDGRIRPSPTPFPGRCAPNGLAPGLQEGLLGAVWGTSDFPGQVSMVGGQWLASFSGPVFVRAKKCVVRVTATFPEMERSVSSTMRKLSGLGV